MTSVPSTVASDFCLTQFQQQAYALWAIWMPWLSIDIAAPGPAASNPAIAPMLQELKTAQGNPKRTQLAIDRLTFTNPVGSDHPFSVQPLLLMFDRTPAEQRMQLLPIAQQLAVLAQSLPAGYNSAQTRGLIAAARLHQKLGQERDRAIPWLQQANKTIAGIAVPLLKAEIQWRLAEAWIELGQVAQGVALLDNLAASLKTLPKRGDDSLALVAGLVENYLKAQQFDKAVAIARSQPPLVQPGGLDQRLVIATAYQRAQQFQAAQTLLEEAIALALKTTPPKDAADERGFILGAGIQRFAQAGGAVAAAKAATHVTTALTTMSVSAQALLWMTIAGEARQQQQPAIAASALKAFVAAGRKGEPFGTGFGTPDDYEWSGPLHTMAYAQGYEPEMAHFLKELKLQRQGIALLIQQAIAAKRFDEAKALIPIPFVEVFEASSFERHIELLLKVAIAAADNGQSQYLVGTAQQMLQDLTKADLADFSRLNSALNVIAALIKYSQKNAAIPIVAHVMKQAETLITRRDQWSDLSAIERAFRQAGFLVEADRLRQGILKQVPTGADQRLQALKHLLPFCTPLAEVLDWAGVWGIRDRSELADWVFEQAIAAQNLPLLVEWVERTNPSPKLRFQRLVWVGNLLQQRGEFGQAIALYDKALAIARREAIALADLESLMKAYWLLSQWQQAKQLLVRFPEGKSRQTYQQQLACWEK